MLLRLLVVKRLGTVAYPAHQKVSLPALSPTMSEGGLAKWLKKEGDSISVGQVLCEVETDKATIDFEFQEDAIIGKRLVQEKTAGIKVGSVIAILVDKVEDVPMFANCTFEEFNQPTDVPVPVLEASSNEPKPIPTPASSTPTPTTAATTAATKPEPKQHQGRVFASPLARKLAREMEYDLGQIAGSGPNGRILAEDVRQFLPQEQEEEEVQEEWVLNKHAAPHFYLNVEVDFTEALQVRAKLNDESKLTLSVNDFILRAASLSMRQVPECNAAWLGHAIRLHNNVDVNVAQASLTGSAGVTYPCLPKINLQGLAGIASLVPIQGQQGTFSLINVGAYGVKSIVPIVRPGQSCALGVGALQQVLLPGNEGARVRTVGTVTLSCDHRVVDGAVGAQWLQHFKSLVEKPLNMLL
ncbi:hypothetical protein BASA81_007836 [Batrachochytrium salamandrivorans]|nr:hypothetical protein BASA81_007836 [Batrachochytrium salamandrivorans]